MKKLIAGILSLSLFGMINHSVAQNDLLFTSANATPEKAIQIHWASNSNEVYEIDYADSLIDTNTDSLTWVKLYDEYPSHGTNTFIADAGNYDSTPPIPHPKNSPMRFYRAMLWMGNDSTSNPFVAVVAPTNGATLSDMVTIQVSASSAEILTDIKLGDYPLTTSNQE